jgi:hypothetical protein
MDQIRVLDNHIGFSPHLGPRTLELLDTLNALDQDEKEVLIKEAKEILKNCNNPYGKPGSVTGLAVGYVQSGKTMSFTTLSAMASDNGFRVIIYLAGTKNNLLEQTTKRLKKDLQVNSLNRKHFKVFQNPQIDNQATNDISRALRMSANPTILITVLKHENHIRELGDIFSDVNIKPHLGNSGVLIIDDEADQASLNTFARSNSRSGDWEEDRYSSTYSSIIDLKSALPNHSLVQYTATPQGPLLISVIDLLSPDFHVVLTPGKSYTGGKAFFIDEPDLILTIPPSEVFHHRHNNLTECPKSLIDALQVHLIGVAIQVNLLKNVDFLSMMVHPDRVNDASEKFYDWVHNIISAWSLTLEQEPGDPSRKELVELFRANYEEATRKFDNPPAFDEVLLEVYEVLLDTAVQLIIQGAGLINWENSSSHILVGAEMLNRGFTVEGLSVTYMPRNTVSRSNADTIQQRCRFFGYKRKYLKSCRVYLPLDSIQDYCDYIEHEELMRQMLSDSSLQAIAQTLLLSNGLNATRNNILSDNVVRYKLSGWRRFNSVEHICENTELIESYFDLNSLTLFKDYKTPIRNHEFLKIDVNSAIEFLRRYGVNGVSDSVRKSSTIQYLKLLAETKQLESVYIIFMSSSEGIMSTRERKFNTTENRKLISNIWSGRSNNGPEEYPGDKSISFEDSLCIQIHKIKLKHNSTQWNDKVLYTLGLYYPEPISHSVIGIANQ